MSHHGMGDGPEDDEDKQRRSMLEALMTHQKQIAGQFPDGRLSKDDDGALAFAVGVTDGKVVLRFPEPTAWLGMTPEQAAELAQLLCRHAANASGKPVSLKYPY